MARLTQEHKLFIVQELACFRTPTEICDLVKAEFDIDVDRQQVQFYNPTKRPFNKKLPKKWVEIFWATRQKYLDDTAAVAVAHKVYRLEERQAALLRQKAARIKNDTLILQILEAAEKDVGNYHTNRREHSGPGGGAIPLDVGSKRKELAGQMLGKLIDKGRSEQEARASLVAMGVNESDLPPAIQ
jgi:hypothetical protein